MSAGRIPGDGPESRAGRPTPSIGRPGRSAFEDGEVLLGWLAAEPEATPQRRRAWGVASGSAASHPREFRPEKRNPGSTAKTAPFDLATRRHSRHNRPMRGPPGPHFW